MIGKSNPEAVEAMARISESNDGKVYVAELRSQLATIDVKLRTASGDDLRRHQGAAQTLEKMINKFEASRTNLKQLQHHNKTS